MWVWGKIRERERDTHNTNKSFEKIDFICGEIGHTHKEHKDECPNCEGSHPVEEHVGSYPFRLQSYYSCDPPCSESIGPSPIDSSVQKI